MEPHIAEQWRQLAVNLTRCEHGRVQGDICLGCPDGVAPDASGRLVGYSLDGEYEIRIPNRDLMHVPIAWYVERSRAD